MEELSAWRLEQRRKEVKHFPFVKLLLWETAEIQELDRRPLLTLPFHLPEAKKVLLTLIASRYWRFSSVQSSRYRIYLLRLASNMEIASFDCAVPTGLIQNDTEYLNNCMRIGIVSVSVSAIMCPPSSDKLPFLGPYLTLREAMAGYIRTSRADFDWGEIYMAAAVARADEEEDLHSVSQFSDGTISVAPIAEQVYTIRDLVYRHSETTIQDIPAELLVRIASKVSAASRVDCIMTDLGNLRLASKAWLSAVRTFVGNVGVVHPDSLTVRKMYPAIPDPIKSLVAVAGKDASYDRHNWIACTGAPDPDFDDSSVEQVIVLDCKHPYLTLPGIKSVFLDKRSTYAVYENGEHIEMIESTIEGVRVLFFGPSSVRRLRCWEVSIHNEAPKLEVAHCQFLHSAVALPRLKQVVTGVFNIEPARVPRLEELDCYILCPSAVRMPALKHLCISSLHPGTAREVADMVMGMEELTIRETVLPSVDLIAKFLMYAIESSRLKTITFVTSIQGRRETGLLEAVIEAAAKSCYLTSFVLDERGPRSWVVNCGDCPMEGTDFHVRRCRSGSCVGKALGRPLYEARESSCHIVRCKRHLK